MVAPPWKAKPTFHDMRLKGKAIAQETYLSDNCQIRTEAQKNLNGGNVPYLSSHEHGAQSQLDKTQADKSVMESACDFSKLVPYRRC
jgi:hypothetical protein